jgi:hypothetical protein
MRTLKIVLGIAILALAGMASVQIGKLEIANLNLREELHDMASLAGVRTGVIAPMSDEELTAEIIRRAQGHGIDLTPDEITVQREGEGALTMLHLSADYTRPVKLVLFSFHLHFTTSSDK